MKALLVGIEASSRTIVAELLGARGHEQTVTGDGVTALEFVRRESPGLVIVADPLADMTAAEFCREARARPTGAETVILVITSRDDEHRALLEAGATDLWPASGAPDALELRVLIAERLVAQCARLRDREARFRHLFELGVADADDRTQAHYRVLFEQSPFSTFLYDPETHRFLAVNEAAIHRYGYSRDAFLQMTLEDIRARGDRPEFTMGAGTLDSRTTRLQHAKMDGAIIDVEVTVDKFILGTRRCCLAVARDVTLQNRIEAQLGQAQKMDAIGSLAAGIAHDFNNLLTVILGNSQMLAAPLAPGHPMREALNEISGAGERASDLTRQLLAFSRGQFVRPRLLDLNACVDGLTKLLRRLLGEDVELTVASGLALGTIRADPGQLDQVLMNLAVNARDAMPNGGRLTIETAKVDFNPGPTASHAGAKAGAYVMLAVTDTGSGMDAVTRERIFEPFFTTKETGKGTGLGLSTVFGIVQQSGGNIHVSSELGHGTSIKVYLPQVEAASLQATDAAVETRALRGSETILLVEDDEHVRAISRSILVRHGYLVLEAQSCGDALLIGEQHRGPIHVLLTDVVMPRMSGRQLAVRLRSMRPEMQVVYMSGYADDSALRSDALPPGDAFLRKPLTQETLTRKLGDVLRSRTRDGSWPRKETVSGTFDVAALTQSRTDPRAARFRRS